MTMNLLTYSLIRLRVELLEMEQMPLVKYFTSKKINMIRLTKAKSKRIQTDSLKLTMIQLRTLVRCSNSKDGDAYNGEDVNLSIT